jgi:hypothetical protein
VAAVPSWVHSFAFVVGHAVDLHGAAPPVHATSHLQESAHRTSPHAPAPAQATLQAAPPQWTLPQPLAPVQSIVQPVPPLQKMLPHAPGAVQPIAQE